MMEHYDEITALIADRATLFRHGLLGLLKERRPGWSCAEAGMLDEAMAHLRVEPVDLVLLDLQLVGMPGATHLRRLRALFPSQKIVVLADSDERATILDCLAAGASGYILKSTTVSQLLRAIETVLSGDVFAPASLAGLAQSAVTQSAVAAREPAASPLLTHLTDRQIEVFHLLSEGCATKTIARRLGLAVGTVKVHLAAIYRVLGAHNRVEAIARARGGIAHRALLPAVGTLVSELCD
jgi:DNA-binding NarL/FixJ family response regulator